MFSFLFRIYAFIGSNLKFIGSNLKNLAIAAPYLLFVVSVVVRRACLADNFVIVVIAHQTFTQQMKVALEDEECPLDAKLESVLPGMRQWMSSNSNDVKQLSKKVDELCDTVEDARDTMLAATKRVESQTDEKLAAAFIELGQYILSRGNGDIPKNAEEVRALTTPETPPQEEQETEPNETSRERTEHDPSRFFLKPQHKQLVDLYQEWHGDGNFADEFGGVVGRNKQFGAKWRKHLDNTLYSRTNRAINAIKNYAEKETMGDGEEAARRLQNVWEACNQKVANFVLKMTNDGYLKAGKPRGKKRKLPQNENTILD